MNTSFSNWSSTLKTAWRSGVAMAIADQGFTSVANFLTTLLLARGLSAHEFGIYSLLFITLTNVGGLINTLVSEPTRVLGVKMNPRRLGSYVTGQLLQNIAVGACVAAVAYPLARGTLDVTAVTAFGFCAALFFNGTQELVRALNASRLQWGSVLASDIVCHGIRLSILMMLMLNEQLQVGAAFWAAAAGAFIGTGIHTFARARPGAPAPQQLQTQITQNWDYGKWLFLEGLVFIASTNVYLYLTALLVDVRSVGAFNAVQTVVNAANVLWMGVTAFSIPAARRVLIDHGAQGWRKYLVSTAFVVVSLTVCIGAALSLFARPLLGLLFSPQYAEYAHLVPILALVMIFTVCNSMLAIVFRTLDMPRAGFETKLTSAVVTLLVAYPLIANFGITGAAIGMVMTQLCWLAVYLYKLFGLRLTFERRVAHIVMLRQGVE